MKNLTYQQFPLLATGLSALLLVGCGDSSSSSSSDDHDHEPVESAGRLATFDTGAGQLKVMDLDGGTVLEAFDFAGETPNLYNSPNHRFVVIAQRDSDLVSFVDGGLYQEDHGDHAHDYDEIPSLMSLTLTDHRPTHYSLGEDNMVVFFDGDEGVASSRVTVLTEATLDSNSVLGNLDRENNMHGVAKMVDNTLFVTYRDPAITDTTLPAEVERYSFDGDSFSFEERYTERCDGLHGAAANAHVLGFGCVDGVLVIDLLDDSYPATKLDNPESLIADSRIGTLVAHHDVEEMVGIAGNQFFIIDAENPADPYQELSIGDGVERVAQGFDAHGEVFYVLGNDGDLRLFDPSNDWSLAHTITVTEALGEEADAPSIAASAASDSLFVMDPATDTITEIDSHEGVIVRTLELDFDASGLVWLGIADGDHGHDDHDH